MTSASILHSSDPTPFLNGEEQILITSPGGEGGSGKLKKGGGSMVQGQVFLKGTMALFLFNFFKIYHFYI